MNCPTACQLRPGNSTRRPRLGIERFAAQDVSEDQQKLVKPLRMEGWDGVEVPKLLRRYLNLKIKLRLPIYLDNEANMGALGENQYGARQAISQMAFVKIGDGIGAGLILNNHLFRGRGMAGEIGHIPLEQEAIKCIGCGNSCLEVLASRSAILKEAHYDESPGIFHKLTAQAMQGDEICRKLLNTQDNE